MDIDEPFEVGEYRINKLFVVGLASCNEFFTAMNKECACYECPKELNKSNSLRHVGLVLQPDVELVPSLLVLLCRSCPQHYLPSLFKSKNNAFPIAKTNSFFLLH